MGGAPDIHDLLVRIERLETALARAAAATEVESLVLRDRDGTPRALLSVEDGAPCLRFADAAMRSRLVLGIAPDGGPFVELADAKGAPRARLATAPGGSPSLTLFNPAGTTSAGLVVLDDGCRQLALFGANGNPSVTV